MPLRTSAMAAVSPPIPPPTTATSRLRRLIIEAALAAGAGCRVEVARAESDPLGLRPVRMELAHGTVELGDNLVLGRPILHEPPGLAAKLLEIFAGGDDHAGVSDLAMPGHYHGRLEPFELLQHGDPAVAVDVDLVGREPRKDCEAPALDEIAGEQDALFGDEDDLVASRVSETARAQLCTAAPKHDLRGPFVREVRLDQLYALELFRDRVAEGPEP